LDFFALRFRVTTLSNSALMAAAARAAHLIVDDSPPLFADTLASALLGDLAEGLLGYHRAHGEHVILAGARTQVLCRSRYTEERLADGVRAGMGQYVILGAGLDTFAYRSDLAQRIRTFEVDRPATQEWKRQQLAETRIEIPATVTYVPVDFEADDLDERLRAAGFDPGLPSLISWLGVSVYLSRAAIAQTLAVVGGFAPGTELVLDYMVPERLRDAAGQTYAEGVAPVAAERGEPWLSFFTPEEMAALLTAHGWGVIEDLCQRDMFDHGWGARHDSLQPALLSRVVRAQVRRAP
jgi:methyltransferase (TIGR00027 family)